MKGQPFFGLFKTFKFTDFLRSFKEKYFISRRFDPAFRTETSDGP
jgi:hypothetical protein